MTRTSALPVPRPTAPGTLVAVDVGGTTIKAARLTLDGRLVERIDLPTPVAGGPEDVVAAVCDTAAALATRDVLAVGVCIPGLLDTDAGVVRWAPNLGLRDTPLAAAVAERVELPVVLRHDVRAALHAERVLGLGAADDLLLLVLGTGIAAGLLVDGRPVRGRTDAAGELGHMPVHVDGEPCSCGQRGCLEVYASAGGLVRRYRAAGGRSDLSAADLVDALPADPVAARVWTDATRTLGQALITATLLLDPALIVLAGGLTGAGARLLDPVTAVLTGGLAWRSAPPLVISPLGGQAGMYGAALHALELAGHADRAAAWGRGLASDRADGLHLVGH